MDTKTNCRFMLVVLFLYLFSDTNICLGADTLSANQSLSRGQTIISAGRVFELGFFRPGNSSNYYLGMWYYQVTPLAVVWVANREKPVLDAFSSELKISEGNLVLFNESKIPIWSTNLNSTGSASVQAVLLDSGNLVLSEVSNSTKPLWQSFDHLTDTILPGSKIGYNKITNTSQILISWKNVEDPAPGLFSLELDPSDSSLNMLWNRSRRFWTSGSWNGRSFSLAPEITSLNFKFFSNGNGSYFTYPCSNSFYCTPISRFVMDVSGQIKQLFWVLPGGWNVFLSHPKKHCEVYAFCGPYGVCSEYPLSSCRCLMGFQPKSPDAWNLDDYSDGCKRENAVQCGDDNLEDDEIERFEKVPSMALPANESSVPDGDGNITKCQLACLSNCFCTAYAYNNRGCLIWMGDLLNMKNLTTGDNNASTLYFRLATYPIKSSRSRNRRHHILLFGIIIFTAVVTCAACLVYYLKRKKVNNKRDNRRNIQRNQAVSLYDSERHIKDFILSGQLKEGEKKGIEVPLVVLESILSATNNFSEENKLGEGGFGPVYKGKFPGGQEIAIKRLSSASGQGSQEFKNEVLLIAKLQHRNLVRLLGYCVEGEEKMLLYEYMPNKSLDSFIFDTKLCHLLSWEIRFNILSGIAKGLLYLHHDSRLRIIHRDLKTSNVLLDEEMNPKISDFGLARIFGGKQIEASTNRVVGTYGYMSPEYALHGFFSIKSDVFSFGVIVFEIISGKRNTGFYHTEEYLSLLDHAWKLWKENKALDLMDPTLRDTCNENEFLRCFNVGLLCVQHDPNERPTMSNVLVMLGNEGGSLPSPKQPAFVVRRALSSGTSSSDKPLSRNEITDSLNEGR